MIEIVPTTWEHVEGILADLCEVHRREIGGNGWSDEEFKARLARFLAESAEAQTMLVDGVPQWMLALQHTHDLGAVTWLLLAQSYFDKGFTPIRVGRRHFKSVATRHGRITSIVAVPGDDVDRWMRWHGFRLVENSGKIRLYICE